MQTNKKQNDTRGLAGQTVGETKICSVNQTQLIYRGYEITDLSKNTTFEETAYLLLEGRKPNKKELDGFKDDLKQRRFLPGSIVEMIKKTATETPGAHPMSVLRSAVSLLSHHEDDLENTSVQSEIKKAKDLLAKIPTIIGVYQHSLEKKNHVEPNQNLDHAGNLLWCMTGREPTPLMQKVMDVSLILYAEHDFNASTFTSRVITSTNSDMYSAVCGGIGALKGNLHGGANEAAMDMLFCIMKDVESEGLSVEQWMERAFIEKRKLMGFGHRVYKNGDHRAGILRSLGLRFVEEEKPEIKKWFDLGDSVQAIMLKHKNIHPNVDFPCGLTYFAMGIPVPQYTPIFVASRVAGWCAHVMEQRSNNRIIRPLALYTGPELKEWCGG